MGIIGRRLVSDFSFEVSMLLFVLLYAAGAPDRGTDGLRWNYPAFSSRVRLIFCERTISRVT
jgi:hypothetical protein